MRSVYEWYAFRGRVEAMLSGGLPYTREIQVTSVLNTLAWVANREAQDPTTVGLAELSEVAAVGLDGRRVRG